MYCVTLLGTLTVFTQFCGSLFVYDTDLARRVTAPATTGEATLVPDRERHPSFIPDPRTPEP